MNDVRDAFSEKFDKKNISEILRTYKAKGLPEREALILIAFVLGKSREYVLSHQELECPDGAIELLEKRLTGYPLQYIVGNVEFYGRQFTVEEGILIPRWETEGLVELAIECIKRFNVKTVAEIGIGSGIISVTLAIETGASVLGTDINPKALEISYANAKRHNVEHLVSFKLGSYLEPFEERFDDIDMIISNPPYVREGIEVQRELLYEPKEALFAGEDGLNFYREFFNRYNIKGKIVVMEIGDDQCAFLQKLTDGKCIKDLAGKDRYLVIIDDKC